MANEPVYRLDWREGDTDLIVALHRQGYAHEGPRFGKDFCDFVGETVREAGLGGDNRSRVWFVEIDGRAVGCAAIVDRGERAQLRWVVLLPEARGGGIGRRLVEQTLDYARNEGFAEVFLETTDGLESSMALYEKLGFVLIQDGPAMLWGSIGQHIVMTLSLVSTAGRRHEQIESEQGDWRPC